VGGGLGVNRLKLKVAVGRAVGGSGVNVEAIVGVAVEVLDGGTGVEVGALKVAVGADWVSVGASVAEGSAAVAVRTVVVTVVGVAVGTVPEIALQPFSSVKTKMAARILYSTDFAIIFVLRT